MIKIGRITADQYDKKSTEYRAKQEQLSRKMVNLQMADESYYLTPEYILNLTKRAKDLFISSEIDKKRELLKLVLQNPTLKGKKVEYTLQSPFKEIVEQVKCSVWLSVPLWNPSVTITDKVPAVLDSGH